jgi:anthraniloyl-CoA monooxygenase
VLGVVVRFEEVVTSLAPFADCDLIVGCDGVASWVRDQHAPNFGPHIDIRPNKFVWLGTTVPFEAFTFIFKEAAAGLFRVHAYPYAMPGAGQTPMSTFIVECTTETWQRAGLSEAGEDQTIAYLEAVFAAELGGHRLLKNRSIWRSFPTVRNQSWRHDNVVLVGDAAHTAHFSIGSGTKLAMEDCIALRDALTQAVNIPAALAIYERDRRPAVEELQQAAQVSLEWFENTERYRQFEPLQFAYSLLTRSLRGIHVSLK